jgi:hypothetical protein
MSSLTVEELQKIIDMLYPVLYYGLDKNMERGSLYLCKETEFSPECIILHPDDFEDVKSTITVRRLVHIKDEPRDKVWSRIAKSWDLMPSRYYNDLSS